MTQISKTHIAMLLIGEKFAENKKIDMQRENIGKNCQNKNVGRYICNYSIIFFQTFLRPRLD